MTYVPQRSLNGGEIAPGALARIDLEKFQSGVRLMRNFFAEAYGGASNRAGSGHVGNVSDHSVYHWALPFEFNTEQAYILLFGDQTMRVIKDGGLVLESTGKAVTDVTAGVFTSAAHGMSNGKELYVSFPTGMTELNGRYFFVANATTDTFTLKLADGTTDLDTTGLTAFTSGNVHPVYEIATPWAEADLPELGFVQSHDTLTVTHRGYPVKDITRTDHDAWTISNYSTAPSTSAPANLAASPSGTTDDYVVTAFDADTGEESVASTSAGGNGANPVALTWDAVAGADQYAIYKDENNSGVYGFIGLANTNAFDDTNIVPDYTDTPPEANDPFDAVGKYPACTAYFEQRQVFGGSTSKPAKLAGSRSGLRGNHSVSSPTKPNDGFEFTLYSKKANAIRHLVDLTYLVAFTSDTVFRIKGKGDEGIGPDSIDVKTQARIGASFVPPLVINSTILFVTRSGKSVRTLSYKLEIDGLDGYAVTALVPHLFRNRKVIQWAWAEDPNDTAWCVTDDGILLGLTFIPEHKVFAWHRHDTDGFVESVATIPEGDESAVYLVVRRTVGGQTRRYVERFCSRSETNVRSMCFLDASLSYDSPTDIEDLDLTGGAATVKVTGHGLAEATVIELDEVYGCEELNTNTDEYESAVNGKKFTVHVVDTNHFELYDLDGVAVDASGWTDYEYGGELRVCVTSVSGIDHLEGRTVSVVADGNVLPDATVSGGSITLDEASARVHVGLPYVAEIETLPLFAPAQLVPNSMQGVQHTVQAIKLLVEDTRGVYVESTGAPGYGTYLDERTVEDWGETAELYTGTVDLPMASSWKPEHRLRLRQEFPLPCTILSVTPEVLAEEDAS